MRSGGLVADIAATREVSTFAESETARWTEWMRLTDEQRVALEGLTSVDEFALLESLTLLRGVRHGDLQAAAVALPSIRVARCADCGRGHAGPCRGGWGSARAS